MVSWHQLPGRTNLDGRIALAEIHGIEQSYLIPVDNVAEVPTYEQVSAGDGGDGDVMRIALMATAYDTRVQVGVPQPACLVGRDNALDTLGRQTPHRTADSGWGRNQLLGQQVGEKQDDRPLAGHAHQRGGFAGEFGIDGSANGGRVRIYA